MVGREVDPSAEARDRPLRVRRLAHSQLLALVAEEGTAERFGTGDGINDEPRARHLPVAPARRHLPVRVGGGDRLGELAAGNSEEWHADTISCYTVYVK